MTLSVKNLVLALAITGFAALEANAQIIITNAFFADTDTASVTPLVSNSDLGQAAGTNVSAVSTDALGAAGRIDGLFNGAVGDGSQDTNEVDYVRANNGSTITVDFDTTVNTDGYDITEILTVSNWNDRADLGYSIDLTYVDGSTAQLLPATFVIDQNPQNSTQHYAVSSLTETGGGFLTDGGAVEATGVESILFTLNNLRNPSVLGEFDIIGVPTTVPEPSSMALLAGISGLLITRRRRS